MYLQLAESSDLLLSKRKKKDKTEKRHPLKAVTLAPGRSLFLLMLDYNIDGLASRLATQDISGLSSQWRKMGGDPDKLVKNINKGKKKKPHKFGFLDKFKGPAALADDGSDENPAGLSNSQKAAIIGASTALGAAIGATIPATAPIAIPGGPVLGTVLVGVMPYIKKGANQTDAQAAAGSTTPDAPVPPSEPVETVADALPWLGRKNFTGFSNSITLIGSTALVAAGGAGYLYKKKNKKGAAIVGALGAATIGGILLYERSQSNSK